jgi:hypothetical protein
MLVFLFNILSYAGDLGTIVASVSAIMFHDHSFILMAELGRFVRNLACPVAVLVNTLCRQFGSYSGVCAHSCISRSQFHFNHSARITFYPPVN